MASADRVVIISTRNHESLTRRSPTTNAPMLSKSHLNKWSLASSLRMNILTAVQGEVVQSVETETTMKIVTGLKAATQTSKGTRNATISNRTTKIRLKSTAKNEIVIRPAGAANTITLTANTKSTITNEEMMPKTSPKKVAQKPSTFTRRRRRTTLTRRLTRRKKTKNPKKRARKRVETDLQLSQKTTTMIESELR